MTRPDNPAPDGEFGRRTRLDAAREVERLVAANASSNATMTRLVEKVQQDALKRERKIELLEAESRQIRRLLTMVGIVTALLLTMAAFNAYSITQARRNAAQTAEIAKDAASTNALLLSCFDVKSECSARNAEQQREVLDDIKRYELAAVFCARTVPAAPDPDGQKWLACVNELYPGGPELPKR